MSEPAAGSRLPSTPSAALMPRLLAIAEQLESSGQTESARALRTAVESWWPEEAAWLERVGRAVSIHHEINNALVGIRGNAQLLLMGPAAQQPKVRERLEVLLRESTRIKDAAATLRELRLGFTDPGPATHAA